MLHQTIYWLLVFYLCNGIFWQLLLWGFIFFAIHKAGIKILVQDLHYKNGCPLWVNLAVYFLLAGGSIVCWPFLAWFSIFMWEPE
jgi:hypothetical protein